MQGARPDAMSEEVVKPHGRPDGARQRLHRTWLCGWLEAEDPNRREHDRIKRLIAFMAGVRDDRFTKLER